MTKQELIKEVSRETKLDQETVSKVFEQIVDSIKGNVSFGREVTIRLFGTFKPHTRKSKTVFDFKNGQTIKMDDKRVVKFIPSKDWQL